MYSIYKICNILNDKIYIGQTSKDIFIRFKQHIKDSINIKYIDRNNRFYNSIRKYGSNNFKIDKIDCCNSKIEADELERKYIKFYNSNNDKFGYNSTEGGGGMIGYKHTEETKKRLSQIHRDTIARLGSPRKGHKLSEEGKNKLREKAIGRLHTMETRLEMTRCRIGKPRKKESILKMKKKSMGSNNGFYGKKMTEEQLNKNKRTRLLNKGKDKTVMQFDKYGKFICYYNCCAEASRMTNISINMINNVCLGKGYTAGEYIWVFKRNFSQDSIDNVVKLIDYSFRKKVA